ncbi:MAG: FAD-dependent oxidoreductase [Proteobacteria bacterium]|nr:FAD-dependent oxidoreductase [Pseudomonadota bacterium]
MSSEAPFVVVGGGWAGCAAAVTLARAGRPVRLVETAGVLGGRARRVPRHGLLLDNGQHLMLGAYRATRALLATLHGTVPLDARRLALVPWTATVPGAVSLKARALPAPLSLLAGLATAHGLTVADRAALLRWFVALSRSGFACAAEATVSALLAPLPAPVRKMLWEPLALAALNTPVDVASGQVFANVLRDTFAGDARASDTLWPALDLTALVGDATARYLAARGGDVLLRTRATLAAGATPAVRIDDHLVAARGVVLAVAPHQLLATLGDAPDADAVREAVALLDYESTTTVYLGYPRAPATASPTRFAQLDAAPGQWLFDRADILARAGAGAPTIGALYAVVVSADGPHLDFGPPALARLVDAQLRQLAPDLAPLMWSQVIAERRATYACTPHSVAARRGLAAAMPARGVRLAGDYVDTDYPATLEAAVRSGVRAAEALLHDTG